MSIKINCLSCGHKVDLDDAYDDYDGPVMCYACGAMLTVKLSEGSIRSVMVSERAPTGKGQSQVGCAVRTGVDE